MAGFAIGYPQYGDYGDFGATCFTSCYLKCSLNPCASSCTDPNGFCMKNCRGQYPSCGRGGGGGIIGPGPAPSPGIDLPKILLFGGLAVGGFWLWRSGILQDFIGGLRRRRA